MVTLVIDNSTSKIEGLTSRQHKKLAGLLSYTIDTQAAYFSNSSWNRKKSLLDKKGSFPTGLLYLVEAWLKKDQLNHTTSDLRKPVSSRGGLFDLNLSVLPYPEQMGAAIKAQVHKRGIVVAPTGVGKSIIAALMVHNLQVPTLIVVPTLELKRQLTESMTKCFGGDKVGRLGMPLAIENVDALDPKKELKGYDCVIIDEFHHSGAKTYRTLNKVAWRGVFYRFGLTATPFRSNDNERLLLESVLSQVIYRVDYQTAVEKSFIVPMEAYYYELPKRVVEGYTWPQVYSELVVNNNERNLLIAELLARMENKSVLCLVKEIKHGENIVDISGTTFANGIDGDSARHINIFNKGCSHLIATTGICGEGVDTKPAEYIIIAGLGKSKNQFMQQVGRGFRTYPNKESCKIIIFKDPSHKWTKAHFAAQVKILREEYGVIPTKLELYE